MLFECHLNWVPLQEIENFLSGQVHESMVDTSPCMEHNPASVIYHDAETQCETKNFFDAETQCDKSITTEYCHTNTCTT